MGNYHKKILLFIILLGNIYLSFGQYIAVENFKKIDVPKDINMSNIILDQNGEACALIVVKTEKNDFDWDIGSMGIVSIKKKPTAYWLYIPWGAKRLTIKHELFGILRNYVFPTSIDEGAKYQMDLITAEIVKKENGELISDLKNNGILKITSAPTGVTININEKDFGITPKTVFNLKEGEYLIKLSKKGYGTISRSVIIENGKTNSINEILPSHRSISITTQPSSLEIFIDDETAGISPLKLDLTYGSHNIKISNAKKIIDTTLVISDDNKYNYKYDVRRGKFKKTKINNIELEFCKVEGGCFTMGSNKYKPNEKPAHPVKVGEFYIGKYEVTQELWNTIMEENPSAFKGDKLPVESVRWKDIKEFIKKLNDLSGYKFRLPTEAEWEFAAKGGIYSESYKFSGSNNAQEIAWTSENSENKTHLAGLKKPNELGIYDMSGNVSERCMGSHKNFYYKSTMDTIIDQPKYLKEAIIKKGGSWMEIPFTCRPSFRDWNYRNWGGSNYGFRLVVDEL